MLRSMPSIVVALDEPHREWIEEAAGEVKAVTGRKDLAAATRPHFMLHVADAYGEGIDATLSRATLNLREPHFETGRIGIFRGPQTVIALEVLRTDELLRLQSTLASAIEPLATHPKPAYAPETWAPHISIIAGRIAPEETDGIMAVLALRNFAWRAPITNLCFVPGAHAREWIRYDIGPSTKGDGGRRR
jgi:2'-5' RNA ligase